LSCHEQFLDDSFGNSDQTVSDPKNNPTATQPEVVIVGFFTTPFFRSFSAPDYFSCVFSGSSGGSCSCSSHNPGHGERFFGIVQPFPLLQLALQ
jgi:hypothetical protein